MAEFSITEWLQKAKADPKVAAQPLLVVLAIIVLGWRFVYSPKKVLLEKERRKNSGVLAQINELKAAVANFEDLKLEVEELKRNREELERLGYRKLESHLFLQDLRKLAKEAGLDIKSISPLTPIPKTFESLTYDEYPVKITFAGDFAKLGIFLRVLETHQKLIYMELPGLVPDASGSFKFDLQPTAILLPEEQPRTDAPPAPEGG